MCILIVCVDSCICSIFSPFPCFINEYYFTELSGGDSRDFVLVFKVMLSNHKPLLVGNFEPKVSPHADDICCKFGFQ